MASAHLIYGVVQPNGYGLNAFTVGSLGSETVASGNMSAQIPSGINAASVKAIGGAVWIAFADSSPNAGANPRIHLASGERFDLSNVRGKVMAVLDA